MSGASPAISLPRPAHDEDGIRIYAGDCADVLPALTAQGELAQLIVTSPPYDDLREFGGHGFDFDKVAPPIAQGLTTGGGVMLGGGGWES